MSERLTYGSYLKVPELLALQHRLSEPPHHDEMLFIIVHQVHELWFKQLLHELTAIRTRLFDGTPLPALKSFQRVHAIWHVLNEQIDVLETMTPAEFNQFRALLKPASGFQSTQFRELELVSGGGDPRVLAHMEPGEALGKVERRLSEPTVYQALLALLARRGHPVPEPLCEIDPTRAPREVDSALVAIFKEIYERATESPAQYELYLLAEAFVEYDELVLSWRARHLRMVERTIGMKTGTGGSEGAPYLRQTLDARFFPELWAVRTVLGT